MQDLFKFLTTQLNEFWTRLDAPSRRRLIIAGVLLVIVVVALSWLGTQKEYAVLYSNLDTKEAGEVLKKLEESGVDVKPEGNGTIMVPKSQEARVRMQLAAEGYPKSGYNYDYFKQGLGLGATDADKRKAEQYQLQERLQTAIKTMDGVRDAIVNIVMPNEDSFVLKEDKQPATASVLLTLDSSSLNKSQIKGIAALVSKSVLGLKAENISIVDTGSGSELNIQENSDAGLASTHFEMENKVRDSLQKQVISLLEPVFGKGNVIASASVRLDFDKKVTEKVEFKPVNDTEGIAVSINELKEKVKNGSGTSASGDSTTGQTQYATTSGSGDNGSYDKSNKTVNYEVNQIKEQIEKAQGQIGALTLSVVLNKAELDQETITSVQNLVSKAIGVSNDMVVLQAMAFDAATAKTAEEAAKAAKKSSPLSMTQIIDISKMVGFGLFIFILLFFIYRILTQLTLVAKNSMQQINREKVESKFINDVMELPQEDITQQQIKRKMDDLVESKPDVVAQQIRNWINES